MAAQVTTITDWISAIAAVITALGLGFVWLQLRLTRIEISDDHLRSRKEKAIEVIGRFATYVADHGSAAKNLGERLSRDQAEAVWSERGFPLDGKYKPYIEATMSDFGTISERKHGDVLMLEISPQQASRLRRAISSYLNEIEVALCAARHNVADDTMVVEQFRFLINPERGFRALENFREIAGGKRAFPSIHWFVQREKKSESASDSGNPATGKV